MIAFFRSLIGKVIRRVMRLWSPPVITPEPGEIRRRLYCERGKQKS
jgi:hypothetical protein